MTPPKLGSRTNIALLALRVVLGAAFILHGWPKVLHPGTWASHMLPRAPAWLGAVAAFAEFGGGIAVLLGILTPLFAFLIACDMFVAIWFVHLPHGASFVNDAAGKTSFEKPLMYLVVALALILAGPGAYSLDGAGGRRPRKRR
ncbi:MAG: DoxX family protein [Candidatus Eremiobacteraeota bacterium]|nr:DoxX family protein [Candidatus Eremiobacteraeota bacterium]